MIYRTEHPNPQFKRDNWICLNGEWQFQTDPSVSGKERRIFKNQADCIRSNSEEVLYVSATPTDFNMYLNCIHNSEKSVDFCRRIFQLYSPCGSYIASQFYCASHSFGGEYNITETDRKSTSFRH